MDRVLQCRAQIKTRNLEITRLSVTASVTSFAHTVPQKGTKEAQVLLPVAREVAENTLKRKNEKFIDMMYYVPNQKDVFINRLVATATAKSEIVDTGEEKPIKFCHVEVSFPCDANNIYFDNDKTMGFSIVQNSKVHFRLKSWREEYVAIRIYLDADIYVKLYNICTILALQDIKFDKFGMYAAVLLPVEVLRHRNRSQHGTYCSKIITEVLQQCKIGGPALAASQACQSTPNLLYMSLGGRKMCHTRAFGG